jgi:hypothetical protein
MKPDIKSVLKDASQSFEETFNYYFNEKVSPENESETKLWAISSLIHLDQIRLFEAYDSCSVAGFPRLLWMAEIFSKLFEAKKWYFRKGINLLHDVAEAKGQLDQVKIKISDLRKNHDLETIKRFKDYRDKFGYHYDEKAIVFLKDFTNEEYDTFIKVLMTFIKFSQQWLLILREIITIKVQ